MNRREYVIGAAATAGAFAGCLGRRSGSIDAPGTDISLDAAGGSGTWPQLAHDARNSRYAPGASGPVDDPEVQWQAFGDRYLTRPVIEDGVYCKARWMEGTAFAFEADGTERWSDPSDKGGGDYPPVIVDELAVFVREEIEAYATNDGSQQWVAKPDSYQAGGRNPPNAPTVAEGRLYLATNDGLVAFDAVSGNVDWEVAIEESKSGGDETFTWSTPAVANGRAYTFDRGYGSESLPVYAFDAETGETDWQTDIEFDEPLDQQRAFNGHVVADSDHVFVQVRTIVSGPLGDSSDHEWEAWLFALDNTTGAIDWTAELPMRATTPPALADGVLFVPMRHPEERGGALVTVDADDGSMLWAYETSAGSVQTPAVTLETVYVGQGSELVAIAVEDGSRRWALDCGGPVTSSIVANESVYARTGRGQDDENELVAIREQ
ncbi:PQQ-binding-like beta-propeller repeat protein [Halobacteria archaeon AArc-m2/3/4]|uniref:PQQ-binding-like beta-propeller repeat protein n=1 Tax=Natronoglomus mannanivorans TaxID=2979990 RepID=A0ABT2QAM6_9EURY|nr:PQQ-binding-like beta-propeller repeat protein [Halobacteria archaeon AArc-m2/3/4]